MCKLRVVRCYGKWPLPAAGRREGSEGSEGSLLIALWARGRHGVGGGA